MASLRCTRFVECEESINQAFQLRFVPGLVARGLVPRSCAEDKPRRYGMDAFRGRKRNLVPRSEVGEVSLRAPSLVVILSRRRRISAPLRAGSPVAMRAYSTFLHDPEGSHYIGLIGSAAWLCWIIQA